MNFFDIMKKQMAIIPDEEHKKVTHKLADEMISAVGFPDGVMLCSTTTAMVVWHMVPFFKGKYNISLIVEKKE